MSRSTFLGSVAEYYFNNRLAAEKDWSCYTFVFTSHRAGSYFKQELKSLVEASSKMIFGLNICTIDELFAKKSKLVLADELTQTFKLYEIYKQVLIENQVVAPDDKMLTFEFFYSWAQTFMGDFDDIDKYLADPKQLFDNVFEFESLTDDLSHLDEEQRNAIKSFWNVVFQKDAEGKEYHEIFLSIYGCMYEIYDRYRKALEQEGLAYNGMMYRDVAQNFIANADDATAMHYAFIGFNALTSSERVVFKRLSDAKLADFFWDYSKEIIEPMQDEKGRAPRMVQVLGNVLLQQPEGYGAGRFVTVYKEEYPSPKDYELPQNTDNQAIDVTSVAYSQSQVSCVCDWVNKLIEDKKSLSDSAIVLGDESLLVPVLQSLPVDQVNITMGYPLKYTSVYSLIELLSRLDVRSGSVRSSLVIPVIQHPTLTSVLKEECHQLYRQIVDNKYVYLKLSVVSESLARFIKDASQGATQYIKDAIEALYDLLLAHRDAVNAIEIEAIKKLRILANRFAELMTDEMQAEVGEQRLVMRMFISFLASESLDFKGDKYNGLQIMGMMETRSLDYSRICVISLNEGEFPKASTPNTFIPRSLRYLYGLPTVEFRDSIFAYYFFRLIARGKELKLVYHSNAEEGEQSRFLLQLQYQYKLWDGKESVGKRPLTLLSSNAVEIPKTEKVLELLYKRFDGSYNSLAGRDRVLSATAITQYKNCSLEFYFSRVVGLRTQDELEEEATAPIIGKVFHEVMEKLYNPSRYPHIYTEVDRQKLLKGDRQMVVDLVDETYRKYMKIDSGDVYHGRNILYHKAIEDYVLKLIEQDAVDIQFMEPEHTYKVPHQIGDKVIYLGGDVDRMHLETQGENNGAIWVIDYKTGSVKSREYKGIDDLEKYFKDKKVIFQTFLYSHFVYSSQETEHLREKAIIPGVIAVRSLTSNEGLKVAFESQGEILKFTSSSDSRYLEFKDYLDRVVKEILDPDKPFVSAAEDKRCKYCQYGSLCAFYKTKPKV